MSAALQKLDFIVGLIDKVSAPAGKMMRTMDTVTTRIQSGYKKIGYGAAGVVGASYALDRLLAPAKALDRALGEVKSLEVANSVLNDLTKSSLEFSMAYGGSAVNFVNSSYDIQSAINGLVGNELSTFTYASNVLAKGTKADASTITSYVGTMYGIFKTSANAMGKGEWVKMLSGQTAAAVQMFKTTGSEMAGAFATTGAAGVSHGIAMNEQIAILGTLQATMTGTEAGTKYKSFLAGVGKAQDELGLRFTDSHGKMLPMVTILDRIKGKFGEIDTVAESDMLQKAFGRKEAVDLIKLLANDMDGLNTSIGLIGKQKGMDKAIAMAEAIKDPFQVAGAQMKAIQTVLGKAIIPGLLPFLSVVGDGANGLLRWTELFPNLTRWVGIGVVGIIGLIAAFSVLSIAVGVSKFLMVGWGAVMGVINLAMMGFRAAMVLSVAAVWLFNAAWLANPIALVVIAVTALGAALFALFDGWDFVGKAIATWNKLPQWWKNFSTWIKTLSPFEVIGDGIDWLVDKINLIPGIDINTDMPKPISSPSALSPNKPVSGGQGGIINQISNAVGGNNRSIGDVIVNNSGQPMNGQTLLDEMEFAAG